LRRTILPTVFSSFLKGFFNAFTRPAQKHFRCYVLGLTLMIRFRSVQRIAQTFDRGHVDSLHHFLHDAAWDHREVIRQNQEALARTLPERGRTLLVIDDTPIERHGPEIEGAGCHHGPRGLLWGQCAVTAVVRSGAVNFFWDIKGYRPRKTCATKDFRSKIDLAQEVLREADLFGRHFTVVMDSWYSAKRILNQIADLRWTFVTSVRSNRLVVINGHKTRAANLAKGPHVYEKVRLPNGSVVLATERPACLPGFGEVKVVIGKTRHDRRFMITNDLGLSVAQVVRIYAQRVWIETTHENVKQHLGLGELHVRSWRAAQRHWALVLVAHNALVLWDAARPVGGRRRTFGEIIRDFRTQYERPHRRSPCIRTLQQAA
jgi:SRSO17 transposase